MASIDLQTCVFLWSLLVVLGEIPEILRKPDNIITSCLGAGTATYQVDFHGEWTQLAFPRQYPIFRPNAQWSAVIGAIHNSYYQMWDNNTLSSEAFRDFVEKESSGLHTELIVSKNVHVTFAAPALAVGEGTTSANDISVNEDYPLMSMVARIIPSPDWFVGLHDINLCQDGQWVDELSVDLYPWDAGTDQGFMFTSPNYPNDPPEPIYQITSQYPDFYAGSFYYDNLEHLPRMAYVTIKKIEKAGQPSWLDMLLGTSTDLSKEFDRQEESNEKKGFDGMKMSDSGANFIVDNDTLEESGDMMNTQTPTPLNCEVSEWGGWAPCDNICKIGLKRRYRIVTQRHKNGGQKCPKLIDIQTCHIDERYPKRLACAERKIQKETRKYMRKEEKHWELRSRNKYTVRKLGRK